MAGSPAGFDFISQTSRRRRPQGQDGYAQEGYELFLALLSSSCLRLWSPYFDWRPVVVEPIIPVRRPVAVIGRSR
jgi:hypothetical protein